MSANDSSDVAGTNQYPVHAVTSADGSSTDYMVRTRHANSLGHGRITYGQIAPQGNVTNLFGTSSQETNFYISSNAVQLVHEMGITGTMTFPIPATAKHMNAYFPAPTPYWIQQYDVYFGGSLLTSYLREYNVVTTYQVMTFADYQRLAGICFLEGGIDRDRYQDLSFAADAANDVFHAYKPFPLKYGNMAGFAINTAAPGTGDPIRRTYAVGQLGLTDTLYGQHGVSGGTVCQPVEYGAGVPLSAMMPLSMPLALGKTLAAAASADIQEDQGTDKSPNTAAATVNEARTALPIRALDHAVLAPRYTDQVGATDVTRDFYIPLHNWLTVSALWMPHLNQPIRIKCTWATDINSIPIVQDGGVNADGSRYAAPVNITDTFSSTAVSRIRIPEWDTTNKYFISTKDAIDVTPADYANYKGFFVFPRRIEGNCQVNKLNLYLRGYQFNADLAAAIQTMHSRNNVVSRVVVPRVGEYRPERWQKGQRLQWTKQGFTGVFAELNHIICHEAAHERANNAIGRSFQTAAPISKIAATQFTDSSGVPYGVSNIEGGVIQDAFLAFTYKDSMFPYLFRSVCFPFSPDPVGAIMFGERKGSQYLNGLWKMELTPAANRPTNLSKLAIAGQAAGAAARAAAITARNNQLIGADSTTLSTVVREIGNQFATVTEHPTGSITFRYL